MISAEFEAEVKNGLIELPESLRGQFHDRIRVRVSRDEAHGRESLLDQWLASPIQAPGFTPLTREDVHGRR
jgi:hypothetical protein